MSIYKSGLECCGFFERAGAYARKYIEELDIEYAALLETEIPKLERADFEDYQRTGKRLGYENKYFLRRRMLRTFALKAWLGDDNATEPLENIICSICAELTWALPAHCSGRNSRQVIDLFAAETAQSLTEILSLLDGRINGTVTEMALREIRERVLLPYINRTAKYGWERSASNWSAVCGGCVGMTAIYLTDDTEELKMILNPLKETFEYYMKSFSEDGACLEGLYYWCYGMTYLIAFLELYKERTGEEFPVNREKLMKMADFAHCCCISDGITVSFSDGSDRDRIYAGLSAVLTKKYGASPVPEEYIASFSGDDCGRWCRAARDIAWAGKQSCTTLPEYSVLPAAQWEVARGGCYSFAVKGGNNSEPHNHNDVGSFMVLKNGSVILSDLGAGEYTKDYFSEARYSILCCSSRGHSVPVINGQPQVAGGEYGAENFSGGKNEAVLDMSGAYSVSGLKKCRRSAELTEDGIILTDTFVTEEQISVTERFITRMKAVKKEDGADITLNGKAVASLRTEDGCEVYIREYKHRNHDGEEVTVTAVDFSFNVSGMTKFILKIQ